MIFTDENYIRNTVFKREKNAHKGDFGKILIYAGSPGMAGACILCARSALKSGSGLVQILLPDFDTPLLQILQTGVPEATCTDYSHGIRFTDYDAVSAGSGLGLDQESTACTGSRNIRHRILSSILDSCSKVLVLDADALNMISGSSELSDKVRSCRAEVIITPHVGEARRLLHTSDPIKDYDSRIKAAKALADRYNCICILKGAGTLVAYKDDVFENTTGNPGMATAGSGDSLSGIIVSLAGQGYCALDAARTGVFIHGKAGDLAADEMGEMGMISSDIVRMIPHAFNIYY